MAFKRLLIILVICVLAAGGLIWQARPTLISLSESIPVALPHSSTQILGDFVELEATSVPAANRNETSSGPVATTGAVLVSRVIDGDTFELSTGEKVRYIGINTPETKHPTKGVECFGQQAALKNQQLIEGKYIILESEVTNTDRYGRLLRYVWLDGKLLNELLVAEGFALATPYPPDLKHQARLEAAQVEAQLKGNGLWAMCNF